MPSPYDMIQQVKERKKKEDGNKRADKWASIQVSTAQDVRPVEQSGAAPVTQPPQQAQQQASQSRHTNLDAIHKRHNEAMKNATWQKVNTSVVDTSVVDSNKAE